VPLLAKARAFTNTPVFTPILELAAVVGMMEYNALVPPKEMPNRFPEEANAISDITAGMLSMIVATPLLGFTDASKPAASAEYIIVIGHALPQLKKIAVKILAKRI
jgi:hypothetical protein